MPDSVEIPAPVSTTTRRAGRSNAPARWQASASVIERERTQADGGSQARFRPQIDRRVDGPVDGRYLPCWFFSAVRRLRLIFVTGVLALGVGAGAVGFTLYDQYWLRLPPINKLLTYDPPVATRVYADDGQLISEFFFEKRYLTPIDKIPLVVRAAFVAAEDSKFYEHPGIDFEGILRAFFVNVRAGDVVQGGSTITQQVVKSLLLTPERSYRRKIREVILSLKLERELSKDEILYLYLNQIYLGDGNYGIGAAARSYFGKDPSELTLPEAALLAGLPKAPSRYSPTRNAEGALMRQRYVLKRMLEEQLIDEASYHAAIHQGLSVVQRNKPRATPGSYYTEYVRRYLVEHFGERATYHQGFRVYTAMNLDLQQQAEDTVRRGIEKLDLALGYLGPRTKLAKEEVEHRLALDNADPNLAELEVGRIYEGVVTEVKSGKITVTVGRHTSQVDVSKVDWHAEVTAKDRSFEVGDLVETTPVEGKSGRLLALTQSPEVEAALVAIDTRTGQVKAMVGGYDYARSQFNRATQAFRQPGSAFKPLVYAAAFDSGFTPASIILDAPIQFVDHDQIWSPENFTETYYGPTTLRHALEQSRNVVTVRFVQEMGVDAVAKYAEPLRVHATDRPQPLDRARHLRGHAARADRRLHDFRQRRPAPRPGLHHPHRGRGRQAHRGVPDASRRA